PADQIPSSYELDLLKLNIGEGKKISDLQVEDGVRVITNLKEVCVMIVKKIMSDRVIVGLGNPGKKYQYTRHNIGFLVVGEMARRLQLPFKEDRKFFAEVSKGESIHFLKPLTYMNESGSSVAKYLAYRKLSSSQIIVVADDVSIPFGMIRVREKGSSGGHNGLKSVQSYIQTSHYLRVRMGVGSPTNELMDLADYVLAPFSMSEKDELEKFIGLGVDVVQKLIEGPTEAVMNEINRKNSVSIENEKQGEKS
ncbi:aminoacyl-tRNA hydrolase, partial [Chlamydiales bacterium]|nr:aminoacyl-tRNA hydrolase [Chlamydiales bacterium]